MSDVPGAEVYMEYFKQSTMVKRLDDLYWVGVDHHRFGERRSARVVLRAKNVTFTTCAFWHEGMMKCVIPSPKMRELGWMEGNHVSFEVKVQPMRKIGEIPSDLSVALNHASITLDVLPEKQQWHLVMMVKEAKNRTIHQQRIQMAIQEIKNYLSFGGDFDEKV